MAKSRAEIQKAYQERKTLKEEERYYQKERIRQMTYYVPGAELSHSEKRKRNKKNKEILQRHRLKKKNEAAAQVQLEDVSTLGESSGSTLGDSSGSTL